MNKKKQTIVLIATHHYLFKTSGEFFLKEIYDYGDICVISSQPGFSKKALKNAGAKNFLYYRGIKDFFKLFKILKNFNKSNQITILSPNYKLAVSFYVSAIIKLLYKKIKIVEYLNAATTIQFNPEKHWEYRKRLGRPFSSQPYKILYKIIKVNIEANTFFGKFLANTPYFLIGFLNFKNRKILVYFEAEFTSIKSKGMNPVLVDHPLKSEFCPNNLLKTKEKIILIAPSFLGFFEESYEHQIINKWAENIKAIAAAYQNHKIKLKLHPRGRKSSASLLKNKLSTIPNIKIIDTNAEIWPLIFESEIIITETSSIAWQTLILGSKKLFLINIDEDLPHYMDDYVEKTYVHNYDGIKFFEVSAKTDTELDTIKLHEIFK